MGSLLYNERDDWYARDFRGRVCAAATWVCVCRGQGHCITVSLVVKSHKFVRALVEIVKHVK